MWPGSTDVFHCYAHDNESTRRIDQRYSYLSYYLYPRPILTVLVSQYENPERMINMGVQSVVGCKRDTSIRTLK